MSNDQAAHDRLAKLVDAIKSSMWYGEEVELRFHGEGQAIALYSADYDMPAYINADKLIDRLRSHFAQQAPSDGFAMLIEQQEKIAELEASITKLRTFITAEEKRQFERIGRLNDLVVIKNTEIAQHKAALSAVKAAVHHWIDGQVDVIPPGTLPELRAKIAQLEAKLAAAKAPKTTFEGHPLFEVIDRGDRRYAKDGWRWGILDNEGDELLCPHFDRRAADLICSALNVYCEPTLTADDFEEDAPTPAPSADDEGEP